MNNTFDSYLGLNEGFVQNERTFFSSGGTCQVFKERIDRKFYIRKELLPERQNHQAYLAAFKKEFELGQELEHKNIVKYLFFGYNKAQPYIIQEYIDGVNIRTHYLNKNKVATQKTLAKSLQSHMLQLCLAIKYLHSKGIAHGDIKPENLIVEHSSGNLKLIDFGHAIALDTIADSGGTKGYLNAEQPDPFKRDIYALGVTLNEIGRIIGPSPAINKLSEKCIGDSYNAIDDVIDDLADLDKALKHKKRALVVLASLLMLVMLIIGISVTIKNITPTQLNTDEKTIATTQQFDSNEDVSWSFKHGYSFYQAFSDTLMQNASIDRSAAIDIMNNIIVKNYNDWDRQLGKMGIQPKTQEYDDATQSYNRGYYLARQKADSLLNLFKLKPNL